MYYLIAGVMSVIRMETGSFYFFPLHYTAKQNLHMHSHCAESFYSYLDTICDHKLKAETPIHEFNAINTIQQFIVQNHNKSLCTGSGHYLLLLPLPSVDQHRLLIKM